MSCRAWVNGITFENGAAAAIPVTDRGLAFGDGLFETIRVDGGRAVLLPLHMARLGASAAALGIACDISRLEQDVVRFVADCTDAVVKVILTRGSSGRGYLPDPAAAATLIFTEHPAVAWPLEWASEGIVATVCQQRLGISPMLAGHKHLNRLEQVVLRQELAACPGAQEALVSDVEGHVVEGVFSNVFWVQDGVIHTPCLSRAGVRGVMRAFLMQEIMRLGLILREGDYPVADVLTADEVFFCNSLYGVWPVRQLEGGRCRPGTMTRRLQQCWNERYGSS